MQDAKRQMIAKINRIIEIIVCILRMAMSRLVLEGMSYIINVKIFMISIDNLLEDTWLLLNAGINKFFFNVNIDVNIRKDDRQQILNDLEELNNNVNQIWIEIFMRNREIINNKKENAKDVNYKQLENDIVDIVNDKVKDDAEEDKEEEETSFKWFTTRIMKIRELPNKILQRYLKLSEMTCDFNESDSEHQIIQRNVLVIIYMTLVEYKNCLINKIIDIKKRCSVIQLNGIILNAKAIMVHLINEILYSGVSTNMSKHKKRKRKNKQERKRENETVESNCKEENVKNKEEDCEIRKRIKQATVRIERIICDNTNEEVSAVIRNEELTIKCQNEELMFANSILIKITLINRDNMYITLKIVPRHAYELYNNKSEVVKDYTILGIGSKRVIMIKIKLGKSIPTMIINKLTSLMSKIFGENEVNEELETVEEIMVSKCNSVWASKEVMIVRKIQSGTATILISSVNMSNNGDNRDIIVNYKNSTIEPISGDLIVIDNIIYMCYAKSAELCTVIINKLLE